jgi:hypothetical protein
MTTGATVPAIPFYKNPVFVASVTHRLSRM